MSPKSILVIFPARDSAPERWLLLAGSKVVDRGAELAAMPAAEGQVAVLVAPGERVALHWLDLPADLSPAQAEAAARLALGTATLGTAEAIHVAVGAAEDGLRCIGIVESEEMERWLSALRWGGVVPEHVVPEPLLALPPALGYRRQDNGSLSSYRAVADAFTLEADTARHLLGDAAVEPIDDARFEAELADAIARAPLDLGQGRFARRRSWRFDVGAGRRSAALFLALLCATLALSVAELFRYGHAVGRLEREVQALNSSRGSGRASRPAEGANFTNLSAVLFSAVRETANVEIAALEFGRGALAARARADSPATIAALRERIVRSGYRVDAGAPRNDGGRLELSLTVRHP